MKFKLSVVTLFLSLSLFSNAFAAGFMQVANVSKIHGTAFINKQKIKEGAEIAEGMEVKIPKKGDYIEIKFQNGHIVRFMGATVKVETLNPKNTLFNLVKGKIFSAIKTLTQGETFDIKTKQASFAVRGTRFFIDESKKNSYLCVCDGVVATKSDKGEVEVKKDEDLTVSSSSGDLKAVAASKRMIEIGNKVFKEMGAL